MAAPEWKKGVDAQSARSSRTWFSRMSSTIGLLRAFYKGDRCSTCFCPVEIFGHKWAHCQLMMDQFKREEFICTMRCPKGFEYCPHGCTEVRFVTGHACYLHQFVFHGAMAVIGGPSPVMVGKVLTKKDDPLVKMLFRQLRLQLLAAFARGVKPQIRLSEALNAHIEMHFSGAWVERAP